MWFESNNKRKPYLVKYYTNVDDVQPLIENAELDNKILKVIYMKSYSVDAEYKAAYEMDLNNRLHDLKVNDEVKNQIIDFIIVDFK
jgi:ribosomal protein S10